MNFRKYNLFFLLIFIAGTTLWAAKPGRKMLNTWPKGITYEIFVMSFCDSNGDGIGDLNGAASKLDYLSRLGVEAIWLMPISPSPSYHKYDVTDYYGIDPQYGTMADFKNFLQKAHEKNIKVVIDMVINHTAVTHPWFEAAKSDKNSPYRNYYVWTSDTNVIKKEPNNWHKVPGQTERYYGMFWSGMPDLNYDNPKVREEMKKIGRFWLEQVGVDGLRLDAARHIYPDEEADKNHAWWVEYKKEMEAAKKDVYTVGEVWGKDSIVAPFFKGLHANFNFDMWMGIGRTLKNERDTTLVRNLKRAHRLYAQSNPAFIDATFLSNHDQNRIASELKGNEKKIKLAASLLFTLPGSPYIYYGEEIGMLGVKPDEHIREPFLWTSNPADKEYCRWLKPIHSVADSVAPLARQKTDTNSVYNHYRKLIQLRRSSEALTLGDIDTLKNDNRSLLIFTRKYGNESLLVIHNVSAAPQAIKNDWMALPVLFGTATKKSIKESGGKIPAYASLILKMK